MWNYWNAGSTTTYLSRYSPNQGWSNALALNGTDFVNAIVGPNNEIVVYWLQAQADGTDQLQANYIDASGNVSMLESLNIGEIGKTLFDFNMSGWISNDGVLEIFWVAYYSVGSPSLVSVKQSAINLTDVAGTAWQSVQTISEGITEATWAYHLFETIAEPSGNLMLLMNGPQGLETLQRKSNVWEKITPLFPEAPSSPFTPNVAYNSEGQAVLVISNFSVGEISPGNPGFEFRVIVRIYDPNSGWSPLTLINNPRPLPTPEAWNYGSLDGPKISINNKGQIAVAWTDPLETTHNIYANIYDPITGWLGEELATETTMPMGFAKSFSISITNTGDSTIIWDEPEELPNGNIKVRIKSVDRI